MSPLVVFQPQTLPVSTVAAACMALLNDIAGVLPGADGMADVLIYDEEPDQLPSDGLWLGDVRVSERAATMRTASRHGRTEAADCELVIWVARDGEPGSITRLRAWAIRDAVRSIVRGDQFLGGAANLWCEPTDATLVTGISPSGGARCVLLAQTIHMEIRS